MSSTDVSMNNIDKDNINQKIEENNNKLDNNNNSNCNSKLNNKFILKRRNAIANFELLESYQEFIKHYKDKEK